MALAWVCDFCETQERTAEPEFHDSRLREPQGWKRLFIRQFSSPGTVGEGMEALLCAPCAGGVDDAIRLVRERSNASNRL